MKLLEFNLPIPKNVIPIAPVGYLDMTMLVMNAASIATDSGGLQKEAFFHSIPCITLRAETEWPELVDIGASRLVGFSTAEIAKALNSFTSIPPTTSHPYGDGDASHRICSAILQCPQHW
jgi:UDP-GlcNAc3NAcA epimerase